MRPPLTRPLLSFLLCGATENNKPQTGIQTAAKAKSIWHCEKLFWFRFVPGFGCTAILLRTHWSCADPNRYAVGTEEKIKTWGNSITFYQKQNVPAEILILAQKRCSDGAGKRPSSIALMHEESSQVKNHRLNRRHHQHHRPSIRFFDFFC